MPDVLAFHLFAGDNSQFKNAEVGVFVGGIVPFSNQVVVPYAAKESILLSFGSKFGVTVSTKLLYGSVTVSINLLSEVWAACVTPTLLPHTSQIIRVVAKNAAQRNPGKPFDQIM